MRVSFWLENVFCSGPKLDGICGIQWDSIDKGQELKTVRGQLAWYLQIQAVGGVRRQSYW